MAFSWKISQTVIFKEQVPSEKNTKIILVFVNFFIEIMSGDYKGFGNKKYNKWIKLNVLRRHGFATCMENFDWVIYSALIFIHFCFWKLIRNCQGFREQFRVGICIMCGLSCLAYDKSSLIGYTTLKHDKDGMIFLSYNCFYNIIVIYNILWYSLLFLLSIIYNKK